MENKKIISLIAKTGDEGKRLDLFLSEKFLEFNRSQWQKKIKEGIVLVNEKLRMAHYFLRAGDVIKIKNQIGGSEIEKSNIRREEGLKILKKIKILAETSDYVVINKPAGVVVHPGNKYQGVTLVDWLKKQYPAIKDIGEAKERPGIVHRLDKNVSGLMVVALTEETFKCLKGQFKERNIVKEYVALAHERVDQDEGEIQSFLKRSKNKFFFISNIKKTDEREKEAITKYEVIKEFCHYTLIRVKILTGRTHQIRVHLRSIGHSLVGDELYATRNIKKKKQLEIGRIWLYAAKLGFKNLAGEWQKFECSMPEELKKFLEKIK
jgi:23S rRNA pseudouridine1911/1915/1917 synthase